MRITNAYWVLYTTRSLILRALITKLEWPMTLTTGGGGEVNTISNENNTLSLVSMDLHSVSRVSDDRRSRRVAAINATVALALRWHMLDFALRRNLC